jgi:hypothetical protein
MFGDKGDFDCWKRLMPIDHKGMVEPNEYLLMGGRLIMAVFILLPLPFQKGKEKNLVSCKKQPLQKGKEITPFLSSPPKKNSFEEEFLVFQKFHL